MYIFILILDIATVILYCDTTFNQVLQLDLSFGSDNINKIEAKTLAVCY